VCVCVCVCVCVSNVGDDDEVDSYRSVQTMIVCVRSNTTLNGQLMRARVACAGKKWKTVLEVVE
jgi:hypothetical protein